MNIFSKKMFSVGLVLVVLFLFIFAKTNLSKKKVPVSLPKVIVGYNIQSLDTIPLMIAYQKGFFKDQGIEVQLVQVSGSEGAVALSAGKIDIVITGSPRLFGAIEKGVSVKMLSPMSNTNTELFVRPNSGIKKFKDLEGKKVSYGVSGGNKELFLSYLFNKEGVNPKKVKLIDVDNTYLPVALMEKKAVDVIMVTDANYVDQANKLGAIVMPEWKDKNYQKLSTGLVVASNTNFLNNNEENVRRFFKAIIEGNKYLKSNLNDSTIIATKFMKDNTNGAMDINPINLQTLITDGRVSYVLWEDTSTVVNMAKISFELGKVGKLLTENDLYDFRFKEMLESAENEIYGTKTK